MQGHTHISHGALLEVLGIWRALLGCKAFKLSSCIILCALKLDINGSFGKTDIIWHRCWKSLYLRTPEHSAELRQLFNCFDLQPELGLPTGSLCYWDRHLHSKQAEVPRGWPASPWEFLRISKCPGDPGFLSS